MLCMREHIDGLNAFNFIFLGEQLQISCLCSWIATDIYDTPWVGKKYRVNNILMHSSSWRVGNDDVWLAVLLNDLK